MLAHIRFVQCKRKGNISVIIIAILALLFVASATAVGYFFWKSQQNPGEAFGPYTPPTNNPIPVPTPQDQTANWKTYSTSQYGFSLKYPADWSVDLRQNNSGNVFLAVTKKKITDTQPMTHGIIGGLVILIESAGKLSQYFVNEKHQNGVINIDGTSVPTVVSQEPSAIGDPATTTFSLTHGNFNYYFTLPNSYDKNNHDPKFDQILSTFKFTGNQSSDNRILLTPDLYNKYNYSNYPAASVNGGCEPGFNFDSPTTTVNYTNSVNGISVEIPYNPQWGSNKFRVNPYDIRDEGIIFGPIGRGEACSLERPYSLNFIQATSADDSITQIKKDTQLLSGEPIKKVINGLTVIEYSFSGMSAYTNIRVIGNKNNYEFYGADSDVTFFENIIKTIKLL